MVELGVSTFGETTVLEGTGQIYSHDELIRQLVAEKLIRMIEDLGLDRFMLHLPLGSMPHDQVLKAIELFGTQVAPKIRAYFTMKEGL